MKIITITCLAFFIQSLLPNNKIYGQRSGKDCDKMSWAVWQRFSGKTATGVIDDKGFKVGLTIRSNFDFDGSDHIWGLDRLGGFGSSIPNNTTPALNWSKGGNGKITMCFSKSVKNPVLMIGSLGTRDKGGIAVTLRFSKPFERVSGGQGITYNSSTSLTGLEGFAIVRFKGDVNCLTIVSSTYEVYTNLTWGLPALCQENAKPPNLVLKKIEQPLPIKKIEPKEASKPQQVVKLNSEPKVLPTAELKELNKTSTNHLKIQIWDSDCMDFDTIAIFFNGKQVGKPQIQLPLYKRDSPECLYNLDLLPGENTLEVEAVSEGVKPLVAFGILMMYDDKHRKQYYVMKPKEKVLIKL